MANWGAIAGGVVDGMEIAERRRLNRNRDARENERHQFDMGERYRQAESRDRQEAAWDELNAAIARRLQKQAPTQPAAPQQPAAGAIEQGNGVQTMPFQDDGTGIPARALPDTEGADPGFMPVQSPAPAPGGLVRTPAPAQPASPAPTAGQGGQDAGRQIGFSLYQNPNLLRDPEFLNEAAGIFMKARMPEGVKWLERGFAAQQENGIDAMKAFLAGDAQRGIAAYNASGREKIESARQITEGEHKGKWEIRAQGYEQPMIVDPGAALRSYLDPKAYFDSISKEQEGKRKDAESAATVKEREANVKLRESQAAYYSGARTAQANAQASRAARQPESKESVDRAHQFVDSQIQRLSSVTDPKGVQVIDPDTKKPSVNQSRQNDYYKLYNDIQLDVETLLGRDLTSREIRFLGQRMASAPMDDDAKRSAWARQTISMLAGRPTSASGERPSNGGVAPSRSAAPPEGSRVRGPDGRVYIVKNGQPVPEQEASPVQGSDPPPAASPSGLTRRSQAAGSIAPNGDIIGKINIQDQSAAADVEARNPALKKLGDALRMTVASRSPRMQTEAAQIYQQYVEELRATLGMAPTGGAISIQRGATPDVVAGLQRRGG